MSYTGVSVVEVKSELIAKLYETKKLETSFDKRYKFVQNEYVVIKDITGSNQSAITRVVGGDLQLLKLPKRLNVSGIEPRNKEQWMALDALLDDSIKVVVLTGRAGTGKTLLTIAAGLAKMEEKCYERMILTRPMSQVTKHQLGILPGEVNEKFMPYLDNYMDNFTQLVKGKKDTQSLTEHYHIEFKPLQLIRGASWQNAFIIADEVQVLTHHDMVTLGTRVGENSKIVIMGDLGQRDENIAREKTGIYKFVNNEQAQDSQLVASIELIKCERSPVASLFADVFEV
jgi:PhoH-like ATPase